MCVPEDRTLRYALLEPLESKYSQNMDFEYVLGSALITTKGRRREGVERMREGCQGRLDGRRLHAGGGNAAATE